MLSRPPMAKSASAHSVSAFDVAINRSTVGCPGLSEDAKRMAMSFFFTHNYYFSISFKPDLTCSLPESRSLLKLSDGV